MKKQLLFAAALLVGATSFAQDGLTSKKGEAFLPEAGDWALGFDGGSFVNFVGNIANGTEDQSLTLNNGDNTFYGKMFKDDKTAYRGMLRIGFGSSSAETTPFEQNSVNTPYTNTNNISDALTLMIGGGLEKRRGNGRLQGVYGAQLMFGMVANSNTSTEYGRALDVTNTNGGAARELENNNGNSMMFGLEGFGGFEYFILPKFSLGAEVTWGFNYTNTAESNVVNEFYGVAATDATGTAAYVVTETTIDGGSSNEFSLDNSAGANFKVMFHF